MIFHQSDKSHWWKIIQYCFLFLRVLRCFTSPGTLRTTLLVRFPLMAGGFPHLEIFGSKVISHLPEAYRRLLTSFIAFTSLGIHRAPLWSPARRSIYHKTIFLVEFWLHAKTCNQVCTFDYLPIRIQFSKVSCSNKKTACKWRHAYKTHWSFLTFYPPLCMIVFFINTYWIQY